jgi:hypothetical protein
MRNDIYKRPIGYNFDGEPKLIMGADGVDIELRGGQPVMDAGLENWAFIGLFSKKGWWGNNVLDADYRIGDSDFDDLTSEPLTRTMLINSDKAARLSLQSMIDKRVASEIVPVISPRSGGLGLDFQMQIRGPQGTIENLLLQKYGLNWVRQTTDPANERLTDAY